MSDTAIFHRTVHGEASPNVIAYVVSAVVVAAVVAALVGCYICWRKRRAARARESRAPASTPRRQDPEETAALRIQENGSSVGAGAQGDETQARAPEAEHSVSVAVAVADDVCGMCRAAYGAQGAEAPQLLECGHCFHSRCIQRWLRVNLACPTCNKTHIMMCGENRGEVSAPRHRYTASMGIDGSTSSKDDIVVGRSSFHF